MRNTRVLIFSLLFLAGTAVCQRYIEADPFDLLVHEKESFANSRFESPLLIRPVFKEAGEFRNNWSVKFRSEAFYNNNAPNLENTSDRWIGKGVSTFNSLNISYSGKFIAFSAEPFAFYNENREYKIPRRVRLFSRLNDMPAHPKGPYRVSDMRETQFYLHYKHIGLGMSNANMWWGPGLHSSLNMTNNTTGFKHYMLGTLREKRIRNVGVDIRYIFAELDKNVVKPYFSALVFNLSVHTEPVISAGFSRSFLSGGDWSREEITAKQAARLPFQPFFLKYNKSTADYRGQVVDKWEHTVTGFLTLDFPESGLRVFIELGRDESPFDREDFRTQPDHTGASIIGFRKYGFFNNPQLIMGFEYAGIVRSRFWTTRQTIGWYSKSAYDFSSYDGRRWAAHSGSDSDDFLLYFGYMGDKLTVIPAFNYERHGVIYHSYWPQVKFEFRLDLRYQYRGYQLNLFFENELLENLAFRTQASRRTGVVWIGLQKNFSSFKIPSLRIRK